MWFNTKVGYTLLLFLLFLYDLFHTFFFLTPTESSSMTSTQTNDLQFYYDKTIFREAIFQNPSEITLGQYLHFHLVNSNLCKPGY